MDSTTVLNKTLKGVDELAQRTGEVPQKLRPMLILVDGKTSFADLLRKCSFIQQCQEQLAWLVQHGFIQAAPADPVTNPPVTAGSNAASYSPMPIPVAASPKRALLALAHDLLGAHADAVVQRLQDSGDTREALAQTLERCHKLIRLSIDEKKAEQFRRLGSELLA